MDLGISLQGAGKIIRSAASVAIIQNRLPTSAVRLRVFARPAREGSYLVDTIIAPLMPVLPIFATSASKAIELIVSYAISRFTKKDDATDRAFALAQQSLTEMGLTTRAAVEAIEKVSVGQKMSVRQFVAPIGDTCNTAMIGIQSNGVLVFDRADREAIEAQEDVSIGDEAEYAVLISELDLKNRTCKFQIRGDSEEKRFSGIITDPSVIMPKNNYSVALSDAHWLSVRAKPEFIGGEISRLHISDSSL